MESPPASSASTGLLPSILILTKDEELNIAACLECCLTFSDDVVVLDSYSIDRTVEIAKSFANVRVIQRQFDTEYQQRNFGLHEILYQHEWVYISDADERIPPALADEIVQTVNDSSQPYEAYRLRYKNMFRGKWIRFASGYPVWLIRLVRPRAVSYEVRETNVHPIVNGRVGELKHHFIHYSFNKGLAHWFSKHNFYSEMEARAAIKITEGSAAHWLAALFNKDRAIRRRAQKNLSFFMPARSVLRFLYVYFTRLGFLDGTAGFHYAAMISMYEYWIELKIRERKSDWRGRADQLVDEHLKGLTSTSITAPSAGAAADDGVPLFEVMIPTLNEADHVSEVVANALSLGPVFVLDSGSTDGTQDLARHAGATVVEHPFINYSDQKNWGLDNLPFRSQWVFILDADERITPALRDEIATALCANAAVDGYFINRLPIFMGRPVRHGGMYPSWNLRLLRRGVCRYENRSVHEHMLCNGPTAYLKGEMLHIRRESLSRYIAKHIRYADMESDEWMKMRSGRSQSAPPLKLFPGALGWRQWLRRTLLPRLPASPMWRLLFMYVLRLGFLDGRTGWRLARLMACYEYMISTICEEKKMAARKPDTSRCRAVAERQP